MANNESLLSVIQDTATQTGLQAPVPPSATALTLEFLQLLSAATGVVVDPNVGSNVRSLATTLGAIIEQQNITSRVVLAQNILNLLIAAYGLTVPQAQEASGSVTFSLDSPLTTSAVIPQGTQVGTTGGLVYQTTENLTIPAGNLSGTVPVQATQPGAVYNVPAGAITTVLSSIPQTVSVTNEAPISGGTNAPSISTLLNLVANGALGQATSTPQSIASAVYGISTSTGETVQYATVYEPWLYQSGSGNIPGFTVYIDNGSGAASSNLISAVQSFLLNSATTGVPSKTPAGVPWSVAAVVPVEISVTVTATTYPQYSSNIPTISTLLTNATNSYFQTLNFGDNFDASDLLVVLSNNVSGYIQGISVTSSPASPVTVLPYERAILQQLTLSITPG